MALGYVLEWSRSGSTQMRQRGHLISSAGELRAELAAGETRGGSGRVLVVRRGAVGGDEDVIAALRGVGGIDGEFLMRSRKLGRMRPRRTRARCWWYPEASRTRQGERQGSGCVMALASVWMAAHVPILLVDDDDDDEQSHTKNGSSRVHESAANRQRVRGASVYGRDQQSKHSSRDQKTLTARASSLEEDLWDAVSRVRGDVSVEELVGELVYDRWVDWLAALGPNDDDDAAGTDRDSSLWTAVTALEANLDEAKHRSRHGRLFDAVGPSAWADVLQRLHARAHYRQQRALLIALAQAHQPSRPLASQPSSMSASVGASELAEAAAAAAEVDADTERTLNRIAYLGGVLLPVSIVASVLAIEGPFGPRGDRFWVFWAASLGASAIALLVIYADQLRSLEVWFEVDGGDDNEQGHGDGKEDDAEQEVDLQASSSSSSRRRRRFLVQRWADGRRVRTWRRGELGWTGAAKKMAGYYRWRGTSRMSFARPSEVLRGLPSGRRG